jgi:hypothetical protein
MSDGVYDDQVLGLQEFENNAVWTFSELIQTPELAFERKELRGVNMSREPFKSVDDTLGGRSIELFKLL